MPTDARLARLAEEGDIIIATLQNTAQRAHVGCGQWTAPRRYPCPTACSRGVAVSPVRKTFLRVT
eukprot:scaffold33934_cov129-Isochrysis_galbana.AAC.2